MCIAASGRICEIHQNRAKVEVAGNMLDVSIRLVDAKVGDYVLIHAGCAIEVVNQALSDEIDEIYALLKEVADD